MEEPPQDCPNCHESDVDLYITPSGVRHCGCYYENPSADIHCARDPLSVDMQLRAISTNIRAYEEQDIALARAREANAAELARLKREEQEALRRRTLFAILAHDPEQRTRYIEENQMQPREKNVA